MCIRDRLYLDSGRGASTNNTGCLVFEDPRTAARYTFPRASDCGEVGQISKLWCGDQLELCDLTPGLLVLFESWLAHSVLPHPAARYNHQPRISIAFNVFFNEFQPSSAPTEPSAAVYPAGFHEIPTFALPSMPPVPDLRSPIAREHVHRASKNGLLLWAPTPVWQGLAPTPLQTSVDRVVKHMSRLLAASPQDPAAHMWMRADSTLTPIASSTIREAVSSLRAFVYSQVYWCTASMLRGRIWEGLEPVRAATASDPGSTDRIQVRITNFQVHALREGVGRSMVDGTAGDGWGSGAGWYDPSFRDASSQLCGWVTLTDSDGTRDAGLWQYSDPRWQNEDPAQTKFPPGTNKHTDGFVAESAARRVMISPCWLKPSVSLHRSPAGRAGQALVYLQFAAEVSSSPSSSKPGSQRCFNDGQCHAPSVSMEIPKAHT
eukprot:TRINITY_DN19556_c0_g1_i3.p1 TRINITY_DN19556_c0_g1~~TRINITY_DN19556_c0_g1_i3.p1  ORF type:complete len:433 (+),score=49.08 TRINITY_DN19556_c0_g1_i3:90-1388(+)